MRKERVLAIVVERREIVRAVALDRQRLVGAVEPADRVWIDGSASSANTTSVGRRTTFVRRVEGGEPLLAEPAIAHERRRIAVLDDDAALVKVRRRVREAKVVSELVHVGLQLVTRQNPDVARTSAAKVAQTAPATLLRRRSDEGGKVSDETGITDARRRTE